MKKIISVVLVVLGFSTHVFSQFTLEQPTFGGSACLPGTASIAYLDGHISVLFDQLTSETTGQFFKKNCAIRFPVLVSEGYQISQDLVQATGFAGISAGRSGQVEVKLLTTGSAQPSTVVVQKFSGLTMQNFNLKTQLNSDGKSKWSPCSQRHTYLMTELTSTITQRPANAPTGENFLFFDELRLQIQARRCQ